MNEAQQKIIDNNNKNYLLEQEDYKQLLNHMKLKEYPILVIVKENNLSPAEKQMLKDNINAKYYYYKQYFLTDSQNKYIFAKTFQDAINKVKTEISNPNSSLQIEYKIENPNQNYKLRISSENSKSSLKTDHFNFPNSNYEYWEINATNAPTSLFSNIRKSIRKIGGKNKIKSKKKKNNSNKKNKFSILNRKHLIAYNL